MMPNIQQFFSSKKDSSMSISTFRHVRIAGIKTSLPEHYINIDDELEYFAGSTKKLARAKKMMGYGRRYIADENTTVTDLAVDAAQKLMTEMGLSADEIELLIFVNQKPDYPEPSDACIAHGVLHLKKSCAALNLNLGCSGYVHGLWTAHAMISSGAVRNCLLLAGDLCGRTTDQTNRKLAPVFGDSASATFLVRSDEDRQASFVLGCDGSSWDRIIHPVGGTRIPLDEETVNLVFKDASGNKWTPQQGMMKGEDVFNFTMAVAPALIKETVHAAGWTVDDVDLFAIHQANKQIVENIIEKAGIPADKSPADVFSKYANHSTNSVLTVLCDQPADAVLRKIIFSTFGIGLSWAGAALDVSGMYNGGFSTYMPPTDKLSRADRLAHWAKHFKGE